MNLKIFKQKKQNNMRISWGWKIAILYTGFVVLIVTLVFKSLHQHVELVAPDYYEQEIAYQKRIDAGKNQSALSAPVNVHANKEFVLFEFPAEFSARNCKTDIQFYAAANARLDKKFDIDLNEGKIVINRSDLGKTHYQVNISWVSGGKKYFQQSDLDLSL
jgi:hypothetical protein